MTDNKWYDASEILPRRAKQPSILDCSETVLCYLASGAVETAYYRYGYGWDGYDQNTYERDEFDVVYWQYIILPVIKEPKQPRIDGE